MRRTLLVGRIGLILLAGALWACDDGAAEVGADGDCSALLRQCPAGTNPLLGLQAETACEAAVGGVVTDGMGQATAQCIQAGSCRAICQFAVPCRCGVQSITGDGVICASCEGAASCGNGVCEGGETPANCPVDCGGVCEPDERRCNGEVLQECSLQQRWDDLPCPSGDVCEDDGVAARCVRDPGIIGGGDAGPDDDMGPPVAEGRILPGTAEWPAVQPAIRGRTPNALDPIGAVPVLRGGLGTASAAIGGLVHWRIVPDEALIEVIGLSGTLSVDFDGTIIEPVAFTADPDQFCADYAACNNIAEIADCAALVARELESWGPSVLQCMAERIHEREADPGACGVLFFGQGCSQAVPFPDGVAFGAFPTRLAGDRLVGFNDRTATEGIFVDLAAQRSGRFGPLGDLRLQPDDTMLAMSADGRFAAYSAFNGNDRTVVIWDLDADQIRPILPTSGAVTRALRLSADGQVLALLRDRTGDPAQDGPLSLWRVDTEERIYSILPPDRGRFGSLTLSPDGRTLAIVIQPELAIELWDLVAREKRHTLSFQDGTIPQTLEFSPDGRLLAIRYSNFDRALTIWTVDGGQRIYTRVEASLGDFGLDGRVLVIPERLAVDGALLFGDP